MRDVIKCTSIQGRLHMLHGLLVRKAANQKPFENYYSKV